MMCRPLQRISNSISNGWKPNVVYPKGSVVMHNGIRYYADNQIEESQIFDASKWKVQTVQDALVGGGITEGCVKHDDFVGVNEISGRFSEEQIVSKLNDVIRILKGVSA